MLLYVIQHFVLLDTTPHHPQQNTCSHDTGLLPPCTPLWNRQMGSGGWKKQGEDNGKFKLKRNAFGLKTQESN